eukprot:TRINITY_DN529_c0_g1_i1.p1 TRINITY_DN529_c0_g1~~TRINITY_DN529_c0_g1_i1.p1  ORF type:complete len:471 (-),score=38.09 TRINITY_DN529_c0_g1_i1:472-1776(-)
MAATTSLRALRLLRSTYSANPAFTILRKANFLPSFNITEKRSYCTSPSNGNPNKLPNDSNHVLEYLRQERDPEKIREFFDKTAVDDPALGAGLEAYRLVSRKLGKAKSFDKVEHILGRLVSEYNPFSEETALRVMRFYGLASMPDHAVGIFQSLKDRGISPSERSFGSLLAALLDSGNPKLVCRFFDTIGEYGLSPNVYIYNTFVKALCKMKSYDSAVRAVETMKKRDCEPDAVIYDSICDTLYAQLDRKEINYPQIKETLDKLLESCSSESISNSILIRRYAAGGMTNKAMSLFRKSVDMALDLSENSLNHLAIALCMKNKAQKAREVLHAINDPRRRFVHASNMLIRCYAEDNKAETATKLCLEMFDIDRQPDVGTVDVVVDALIKTNRTETDVAQLFIETVRKKMPAFYVQKWNRYLRRAVRKRDIQGKPC